MPPIYGGGIRALDSGVHWGYPSTAWTWPGCAGLQRRRLLTDWGGANLMFNRVAGWCPIGVPFMAGGCGTDGNR